MSKPPGADSPFWKVFHAVTRVHIALLRATGGRFGGRLGQAPVLVLHHVGRVSGQQRKSPLFYLEDASNLVIVASKAGTDNHPAWFHNLMAMDSTEVELSDRRRRRVRPRIATGAERDALWSRLVAMYKSYDDYASHTDREIPVVVLEPA